MPTSRARVTLIIMAIMLEMTVRRDELAAMSRQELEDLVIQNDHDLRAREGVILGLKGNIRALRDQQEQSLSLTTPMGGGAIKGNLTVIIVLLALLCVGTVGLNWRDHAALAMQIKEQTYLMSILTLPEGQRPRVYLVPPPGIQGKIMEPPATPFR